MTHQGENERGSAIWRNHVNCLIREGYGSEDIALMKECKIEAIRSHVQEIREAGILAYWFGL